MAKVSTSSHGLIAALDVGSSKICCLIAAPAEAGRRPHVVGIGHHVSRGVRAGAIVDMEAARAAVLGAVNAAEEMAGETIRGVLVSVSGGQPRSHLFDAKIEIAGSEVGPNDVRRVLQQGRQHKNGADGEIIHSIPIGFRIDDSRGVRDPRGMYGASLAVDMHVVSADTAPVRNLTSCITGCHLDVDDFVVAGYAAGLACLVADETKLGSVVVDMGAGTTSLAVFAGGEVVYSDSIARGGNHITSDIARGLATPLDDAERLKVQFGAAEISGADEHAIIDVPALGAEGRQAPNQISRSMLVAIIRPRLEQVLTAVRDCLAAGGFRNLAGTPIVLTGGASQIRGLSELAAEVLGARVRLGRPLGFAGLAEAARGPSFSAAAGLLAYAGRSLASAETQPAVRKGEPRGLVGRASQWLHENF